MTYKLSQSEPKIILFCLTILIVIITASQSLLLYAAIALPSTPMFFRICMILFPIICIFFFVSSFARKGLHNLNEITSGDINSYTLKLDGIGLIVETTNFVKRIKWQDVHALSSDKEYTAFHFASKMNKKWLGKPQALCVSTKPNLNFGFLSKIRLEKSLSNLSCKPFMLDGLQVIPLDLIEGKANSIIEEAQKLYKNAQTT